MSQTIIDHNSGNYILLPKCKKKNEKKEQKGENITDLAIAIFFPNVTDTCNHVNNVKTLQQQRKCVLRTCGLCMFRLVTTSNSCLCD